MLFRSDRKSTRLNSSHTIISYAVFCLKKKTKPPRPPPTPPPPPPPHHQPAPGRPPSPHLPASTRVVLLLPVRPAAFVFFFFNDRPPPEIYPFPLHGAFPI